VHQQTDGNDELTQLGKRIGIYLGIFLAGGLITFVYSYSPLHKAKNWKIGYLEERLEARDAELKTVQAELVSVRTDNQDKPDGQTFKLLQDELVTVDKTVTELERKLAKAEKRVKELEKSRKSWKAKAADAEAKRDALAARSAPADSSGPAAAPPASPAPGATTASGGGEQVALGSRWQRGDGLAGFELTGIEGQVATVVADPDRPTAGGTAKSIRVGVGESFEVGTGSGQPSRVAIKRVEPGRAIWIEVAR
jgi:hypothetical protein